MTDDAPSAQLILPSLRIEGSPPSTGSRLAMAAIQARRFDALVHLRCPSCDWRQTLRLPRARPRPIEPLLPRVPVRHWVFSLGESAQPRLATQPRTRTRVARACVAAVFAWLRRAAARGGIEGPVRCGAVSAIHRVGATLEANVHVHALVLDGVYTHDPDGIPVFHPMSAPRRRDLRRTLAELRVTIDAILARAPPPCSPPPVLTRVDHRVEAGPLVHPVASHEVEVQPAEVQPAEVQPDGVRLAREPQADPGPSACRRVEPVIRAPVTPLDARDALIQRDGDLDVRAGPSVAGNDRAVRDRLCRYVARMPFDPRALHLGAEGRLRYRLHHPFSDGTTHVELSPRALAERLESLAGGDWRPPIGFHGVIAPAAATRGRQLSLIDEPRRSRNRPAVPLRCPRCRGPLDIVGVESTERAA